MTIFPLPLTSMEEYLYRDDYPGYPNTISGRFRFRGRISLAIAEHAARLTRERHPLVDCSVERRGRKLQWTPIAAQPQDFKVLDRHEVDDMPHLPGIDLRTEAGGKIYIVHDSEGCDIVIHGHHACLDGVGAMQFIVDWMTLYAQLHEAPMEEPRFGRLDPAALRRRGDYGFGSWNYFKKLPRQSLGLYGIHEFLTHRAIPLVPDARSDAAVPPPEPFPGVASTTWTEADFAAHLNLCRELQVTSNELLTAGLFKALSHWRRSRSFGTNTDWLRIMVPINMRRFEHRRLPAANRVSFISLDRRALPFHRFAELTQSINAQMEIIRQNELDLIFLALLGIYRRLPGGVGRLASPERCGATAILTNLAAPFRRTALPRHDGKLKTGELILEHCDLLPPLRPNTNVAFSAFRYANRQCLTASFDRRILQHEDVAEILDLLSQFAQGKETGRRGAGD